VKRGWRIFVVILGSVALVVIGFGLFGAREPVYQGRTLTSWLGDLRSGDPYITTNGVLAIRHMGTNAVPFLVRMLHAKDSKLKVSCINLMARQRRFKVTYRFDFERREDGLRGLGALGPDAKGAIPEITKLLNTGPDRQMAAYTLSRIGPEAIPALNSALGSTNGSTRGHAAAFLGLQKGQGENVVPGLLKALKDPDFIVKSKAVRALSRFPEQADVIVPALISRLDDPDETFRENVARGLVSFGDKARPAVPRLVKMVETGDFHEGQAAAQALLRIDREAAIDAFTNDLQSPVVGVRRKTALALMSWKANGVPAIPVLIKCLKDQDNEVKQNAAVALREIGSEPEIVVPALMENLNDPDLKVRSITAIAVCEFGERAKPAVPIIIKLIQENSKDELTASGLFNALARIDPDAADKLGKQ